MIRGSGSLNDPARLERAWRVFVFLLSSVPFERVKVMSDSTATVSAKSAVQMTIQEARLILTTASLGAKSDGGSALLGTVVRSEFGLKFDGFSPSSLANVFRQEDVVDRIRRGIDEWEAAVAAKFPDATEGTLKARQKKVSALHSFLSREGLSMIASAIETLIENRALTWSDKGTNGRKYPMSLDLIVNRMLGANDTMNRRSKMGAEF